MPTKTRLLAFELLLVLAAGCSNSSSGGVNEDVVADLHAYETETFEIAKEACGFDGTYAEYQQLEEPATDADTCMFELSASFDDCEVQALGTHEADARKYLTCSERDRTDMLGCCRGSNDLCTYETVEACYETLWAGSLGGLCSFDEVTIQTAIDKCEAESASAEGKSSSDVGGGPSE